MKYIFSAILICISISISSSQESTPTSLYMKVDQFGYLPDALKVAVISNPEVGFNSALAFAPGNTLQVRRWADASIAFSGSPSLWNNGEVHDQSGDRGWWFDFTSVTASGDYYIYDPTNDVRSHRFTIDPDVYNQVLKSSVLMFYRNRSGIAKPSQHNGSKWSDAGVSFAQDENTRDLWDRNNPAKYKDMSGGWFDAGDYNKYVTFTQTVVHDLLWAYRENPGVFGDDWNIPESGNGIPDILDEIMWELDWLKKMNNPDGSTHIKMGSLNYADNGNNLPSTNTDPRYYGPTCSSAEIVTAGLFAHAAKVLEPFSILTAYANDLESRAETTWSHVVAQLNNPNTLDLDCDLADDDNRIVSGDADLSLLTQVNSGLASAIYLYDVTGKAIYQTYINSHLYNAEPLSANPFWSPYERPLIDALLHYSSLSGVNGTHRSDIRTSYSNEITGHVYFGMNEEDLYRSAMRDDQYHWGSNQMKGIYGVMNLLANKYNLSGAAAESYESKALEFVHYFHGLNGMGLTYLTNMRALGAENSVNEMYHQWFGEGSIWDNAIDSPNGPAPGFLVGGPNAFTTIPLGPPSDQPSHKSYLDFNSIQNASWECSEPAIYYQSGYIRLLAAFANEPSTCPAEGTACDDGDSRTTNDLSDGFCGCSGDCPPRGTACDDNDPLTVNDQENGACLCLGGEAAPANSCDIISNGNLDTNTEFWSNYGCDATWNNGQVNISNIETVNNPPWESGFFQEGLSLVEGREYTLSFSAFASAPRSIVLSVSIANGPTIYIDQNLQIGTAENTYSVTFTNDAYTTGAAQVFLFLGASATELSLDNFSLGEASCFLCGDNIIENSSFDTQVDPWFSWGSLSAIANNEVHISSITGTDPWNAGFFQQGIEFIQGQTYTLLFDARSTAARAMVVKAAFYGPTDHEYMYQEVNLTNAMTNYQMSFVANHNTVTDGRIEFYIGSEASDIYMDNIVLLDGNCDNNSDCLWSMDISGPITESIYQAENNISSTAIIDDPKTVQFNASEFIQLNAGFEVESGAAFETMMVGCN